MPLLEGAHDRRARLVTGAVLGQRTSLPASESAHVTVVGGGLGGVAAAIVLSEHGVAVTLHEAGDELGGRLSSWPDQLSEAAGGTPIQMERGFHAFFRQYYNTRNLLRRVDPSLGFLMPCDDYPLFGPNAATESFAGLPRRPPFNLVALVKRTATIRLRDLASIDGDAAAEMLAYDGDDTYARLDSTSAAQYLDSVRFPAEARRMLFEVFAHSFFNPQESMSAAEMLMMFHLYFCGSAEGILFDVLNAPFGVAVWQPMEALLRGLDVDVRLGSRITELEEPRDREGIVLATDVEGLRTIVQSNAWIGGTEPTWRADIQSLESAPPFAVWRLWLDGDVRPDRTPFAGTAAVGIIDNISCVHRYQNEARTWAAAHGGSVLELHAYALPRLVQRDVDRVKRELLASLHALYPETATMRVLDDRFLIRNDCPAFPPGSIGRRPVVATPTARVVIAGDCTRLPFPTALMERAVTSGFLAANSFLEAWNVRPEPIWSIPPRGVLATLQAWQRRRRSA